MPFFANLQNTSASALLGTVFLAAGWLVTHTVEAIISIPAIQYEYKVIPQDNDIKKLEVTIRNLSNTHKFSTLNFIFLLPDDQGSIFKDHKFIAISPGYPGQEKIIKDNDNKSVTFTMTGIHPGNSLILAVYYIGKQIPTFHIQSESESTKLLKRNYLTWLIRNEIETLFLLFVLWTILVIFLITQLKESNGNGKRGTCNVDVQPHT